MKLFENTSYHQVKNGTIKVYKFKNNEEVIIKTNAREMKLSDAISQKY